MVQRSILWETASSSGVRGAGEKWYRRLITIMEALDATPRRRNKTTSDEDRKRVITAYENGVAGKDIALMLNLHRATVYSIIKKFQKTWNVEAAKRGGNRAKLLPEEAVQSIRTWIDEDCTVTLKALAEKVHERYSVRPIYKYRTTSDVVTILNVTMKIGLL
uniref:Paired domain-containing protein n=1 Tax=Anopheles coluzzii TaxID=1518534 RepID=A0A8W7PUP2_ANOCL